MSSIGKQAQKPQVPPLRYASVGMTKGEAGASMESSC
jgi:hypothetical protein